MGSSAAKFVSAMVAGIVAAAPLSVPDRPANAAECLTQPGQTTPKGQRWHYHLEAGTKRHCWYLRDEGGNAAPAASASDSAFSPAPEPAAQISQATPRSLEDAHAEFPAPLPSSASRPATPAQAVTSPAPDTASPSSAPSQTDAAGDSALASRWPAPADTAPPAVAAPSAAQADDPEPDVQAAAAPPAPSVAAERAPASLQMLFAVIIGALALAGITASIVVRLGRARRVRVQTTRRGTIWDRVDHAAEPELDASEQDFAPISEPPWVEPVIEQAAPAVLDVPRPRRPRLGVTQERYQKIEEILAELVKQVQQGDAEPVTSDRHLSS